MSRISNALNMYMILQGRSMVKADEIAEILEVTPRMVNEYKNDLEKAGIYIGSKRGRNGGYYLENTFSLKGLAITDDEIEALKMANEIIRSGNYPYSIEFETLSGKIFNAKKDFKYPSYYSKPIFKHMEMKEKEKKIWIDVNKAIIGKKKIKMNYGSLGQNERKIKSRTVHPHGTFDYEGGMYFYGYCEFRKEVRFFKLSRIDDYDILDERFTINNKYDIKEIINKSFGIYDSELINLKLKIYYPMSQIVKEKQYSINQEIEEIDDRTIYFKAKMKGYVEIKSWVMSMGSLVEVIEPVRLKEDILDEMQKLIDLYR